MKQLLIARTGAYGDYIVNSSVFPFLIDKYRPIHLEVNSKGLELFGNDPRFAFVSFFESQKETEEEQAQDYFSRWESLRLHCESEGIKYINFWSTLENCGILHEQHADVNLPREERETKYGKNFYEMTFAKAEVEIPAGWMHENTIHFPDALERKCQQWREKNKDFFTMLVAIGGSSRQKVFPTWIQSFCNGLIDQYPQLKIYLMGGSELVNDVWEYERTFSYVNGTGTYIPFKQALLMTKYSDYCLGGETGLMVGAGMLGVPKTMLWTLGNMTQMVNYHRNDYSLQSNAACSPCYTMAYSGLICPKEPVYNAFPICTHEFDLNELANIFDKLYTKRF